MFLYTALFVASLLAALVILVVVRTIKYNAGSVYKTVIPEIEIGSTGHLKSKPVPITSGGSHSGGSQSPWGWKGHETPANAAKTHAALPTEKPHWDWSGSRNEVHDQLSQNGPYDNLSKPATTRNAGAGWPQREEKLEFAGKAYKVTRKAPSQTSDVGTADKPWGW
jgi:hypothetical protein